jgi:CheY-like chemotaxis protein
MTQSMLNNKRILVVDDEPDVLNTLNDEIMAVAPRCIIDRATTFEHAVELLICWSYDLVILDIMGVRGFDLLERTTQRECPIPTVMLTSYPYSWDTMKSVQELGVRAYLPKEKLGNIVPYLEEVLSYEYGPIWKRLIMITAGAINRQWGPYWQRPDYIFHDVLGFKTAQK